VKACLCLPTMHRLVSAAYPACHARMRMAALDRAEPRLSRRLCTDRSDPYAVLGVPQTADQAEVRRQYLKLAKETHPDVSAGDDAAFRRVSWAYEQLSGKREELEGPSTPWQARRPASPGAKAYHRDQQGVAKAMMAMQLAAAGKRADALELLLSASTGKLPGAGEKAALFVFDSCTAHSFSQQPVEHAKVWLLPCHARQRGGRTVCALRHAGAHTVARVGAAGGHSLAMAAPARRRGRAGLRGVEVEGHTRAATVGLS